ncbi:aspartic proteinase-like protein 2 [Papaver somniferum]|uniref:aspartic proteinase-like protein 2 n=1 Tax=Papaver somniferum TaxID=3469 RepID=UPI000E6FC29E|nr:aspartic proteinase-like protein 2 [Papaver somniferum]
MGIRKLVFFFVLVFSSVFVDGEGRGVFKVKHKFGSEADRSLKELTVHDKNRHGRLLAAIDIPLGGDGKATGTGLYYTKLAIGSPPKDYFFHVDTGSDILWINCVGCSPCATFTDIDHLTLKLYDPKLSSTTELVPCNGGFCTEFSKGPSPGCSSNDVCGYVLHYGDGSGSAGYFVQDVIRFDQVTGNLQTSIGNASISFGCGMEQTGKLALSIGALDGLIGFGASNTSILSQLASSGKTKKKFAHCLDGKNGGGIFVIGDVVKPILKTTPLVPNAAHYNVNMESVRVGDIFLDIPKEIFQDGYGKGTIIDSGTTLAYLSGEIFDPLRRIILTSQANLNVHLVDDILECFKFDKSIDDSFPTVTFGFQNSLELKVYPHDYLILYENEWCIGWQDSGNLGSNAVDELIILGDLVLTNKLVLYDLENQVLGLSDYNCSSTIGLKDEVSGAVNQVGSHDLSSSPSRNQMGVSCSTAHYHMNF